MKHNNKYLLVPKRRVRYRKKDLQKRGDGDGSGETPMNALKIM